MQVFANVGHEMLGKRASILAILAKSPRAMEIWQIWERGYMFVIVEITKEHFIYFLLQCLARGPGPLQAEGSRFLNDSNGSLKTERSGVSTGTTSLCMCRLA
jgi:hypothetical protein